MTLYNTGNNVFARAIVSYFYGENVTVMTRKEAEAALGVNRNWCRENFDVVITYEACLFSSHYRNDMHKMAAFFRRLAVPIYVIGVGVLAQRQSAVSFVDSFSESICDFMDSVYSSGGEITVRGEFTKDVCAHVGYGNVFVSGCGSLYYNGENFEISNTKVDRRDFVPILNGYYVNDINPRIFKRYPRSIFFDQDIYYRAIKYPGLVSASEVRRLSCRQLLELYSTLIGKRKNDAEERLQTWQTVPQWQSAIERSGATFSYGSRMHGNMIALLTRVPAYLRVIDARTEELADFYKIPNSLKIDFDERKDSLYDLYLSLDWNEFNSNYRCILSRFSKWLDLKCLPNRIGRNSAIITERAVVGPPNEILLQERKLLARKLFWSRWLPFGA